MQERFGRYGLKSEVDVRKLWPTIEEIEELNALRLYRKATDAIEIAAKAQKMEKEKKLKKLADVEKNFASYPAKLQAYEESSKKVDEQAVSKEKKNESRVLEVQAYFGYWIDPKDPRFETMMKQKEAEEKKKTKLVKRQEVTAKKKLSAEQSLTEKPKES
uniref:Large ribosomal subunit protein mL64 n=1 Tax=Acrobeloides nanus TaxID=290746 RepID=A0A914D8Z2_9BILA